jgi:hypothetical protein
MLFFLWKEVSRRSRRGAGPLEVLVELIGLDLYIKYLGNNGTILIAN